MNDHILLNHYSQNLLVIIIADALPQPYIRLRGVNTGPPWGPLSHPSIMLQILSLPLVFNHCKAILSTCVVFDQNKWPLFAESLFTKLVGQHSHMPTMATLGQHQTAACVICRVKVHLLADLSYKCSLPPFPFSLSPSLLCLAFSLFFLAELEIDFLIWKSIISNLLLFWCQTNHS